MAKKQTITDKVAWGKEPTWNDVLPVDNSNQIGTAMNWYAYMSKPDDQRKWVVEYYKGVGNDPVRAAAFETSKISERDFYPAGSLCRMQTLGCQLPKKMHTQFLTRMDGLWSTHLNHKPRKEREKSDVKKKPPTLSDPAYCAILENVDLALDHLCEKGTGVVPERLVAWKTNVTLTQIKYLNERFEHTLAELQEAMKGKDAYLKEAYGGYSQKTMQAMVDLLESFKHLKACKGPQTAVLVDGQAVAKPRKERKKKVIPPSKLVAKLLYMKEHPDLKLKSVNPEKIINAKEIWVYDTEKRKLGVYKSVTDAGLLVKGSTILQYNEKESVTKKMRWPEEQIPEFQACGKKQTKKWFDGVKAKAQSISPRLNRETILLKVVDL